MRMVAEIVLRVVSWSLHRRGGGTSLTEWKTWIPFPAAMKIVDRFAVRSAIMSLGSEGLERSRVGSQFITGVFRSYLDEAERSLRERFIASVDQTYPPDHRLGPKRYRRQPIGRNFLFTVGSRDKRQTQARQYKPFDHFSGIQFHRNLQVIVNRVEPGVQARSGGTGFRQEQLFTQEISRQYPFERS